MSSQAPDVPSEGLELVYGPYLRWDLYAQLGYPKIDTIEDLLPILKQMQELSPTNEDGEPVYAFSFLQGLGCEHDECCETAMLLLWL